MGLLQELPSEDAFTSILAPLLGDGEQGTGLAGTLKLLETLDGGKFGSSAAAGLGRTSSTVLSVEGSVSVEGPTARLTAAGSAMPADPQALLAPLLDRIGSVGKLAQDGLSVEIRGAVGGLQGVQQLVPAETSELFADAASGIARVEAELTTGAFGALRQWSTGIDTLWQRIEPLLAGGPGTVQERVIAFLAEQIDELIAAVLPSVKGPADVVAEELAAAVSDERLARIAALKTELAGHLVAAKQAVDAGHFGDLAALTAAATSFGKLTAELEEVLGGVRRALASEAGTPAGLAKALAEQIGRIADADVVDLGSVRETVAGAIGSATEAIRSIDLPGARDRVVSMFDELQAAIQAVGLDTISAAVDDLVAEIESVTASAEAGLLEVVASVRSALSAVRDEVRGVASELGTFDEHGHFRFHVQDEIEDFLDSAKTLFTGAVRPAIEEIGTSFEELLGQVESALQAAEEQVEAVRTQLRTTLEGVTATLEELNVPQQLDEIRQQLDDMLASLGEIQFDAVVDPIVAELEEMRDTLAGIDVSSLSEITVGALKVSVEVVTDIDFSTAITEVLMKEIDELLQVPKDALADVERAVEEALARVGQLEPEALLAPLNDVFRPVHDAVQNLRADAVLAPLDEWHEKLKQQVEQVSPAMLLAPLVEAFEELRAQFDKLDPAKLLRPAQAALDAARAEIGRIDVQGIARQLREPIEQARAAVDAIAPERLLEPLVTAYDTIAAALDEVNPAELLKPAIDLIDGLTAPLEALEDEHVAAVAVAFAPLEQLPTALDPARNYTVLRAAYATTGERLRTLDVGATIAALRGPHEGLRVSVQAGGSGASPLTASVDALNPVRSDALGRVGTGFRELLEKLAVPEAQLTPPPELSKRYEDAKPRLEALVPSWLTGTPTVAGVRDAVRRANPLNVVPEVTAAYDELKRQVHALDPRVVQDEIRETFDALKQAVFGIDLDGVVAAVDRVANFVPDKLAALDLGFVEEELSDIVGDVRSVLDGLDPRGVADELEELKTAVEEAVDALKPSVLLAGLDEPLERVRNLVDAFDPAALAEPLADVLEAVQAVIAQIDVGVILEPLVRRLEELRDELEESLQRTEDAFDEMLNAIPV